MNKTYSQKTEDISRKWYLVDAQGVPLGRLSTEVAKLIMGKNKVTFTPHVDNGDFVVVINASQVVLTGNKASSEFKYRYSGYPGGLTATAKGEVRSVNPEKLIRLAVSGMIPTNKLKTDRIKRLRVFAGSEHEHTAQMPVRIEVNS